MIALPDFDHGKLFGLLHYTYYYDDALLLKKRKIERREFPGC